METPSDDKPVYIYALCEPDGLTVRYIGASLDPQRRFADHLAQARRPTNCSAKDLWLRALLAQDLMPTLLILATTTVEHGPSAEYQTIEDHIARGCALTNTLRGNLAIGLTWMAHRPHAIRSELSASQKKAFGQRVRAARHQHFLTLVQLAHDVGVDWRVVQRWEAGRAFPHPRFLARLCARLGVSRDDLVDAPTKEVVDN